MMVHDVIIILHSRNLIKQRDMSESRYHIPIANAYHLLTSYG